MTYVLNTDPTRSFVINDVNILQVFKYVRRYLLVQFHPGREYAYVLTKNEIHNYLYIMSHDF